MNTTMIMTINMNKNTNMTPDMITPTTMTMTTDMKQPRATNMPKAK